MTAYSMKVSKERKREKRWKEGEREEEDGGREEGRQREASKTETYKISCNHVVASIIFVVFS